MKDTKITVPETHTNKKEVSVTSLLSEIGVVPEKNLKVRIFDNPTGKTIGNVEIQMTAGPASRPLVKLDDGKIHVAGEWRPGDQLVALDNPAPLMQKDSETGEMKPVYREYTRNGQVQRVVRRKLSNSRMYAKYLQGIQKALETLAEEGWGYARNGDLIPPDQCDKNTGRLSVALKSTAPKGEVKNENNGKKGGKAPA
jgi:hypothetical protein